MVTSPVNDWVILTGGRNMNLNGLELTNTMIEWRNNSEKWVILDQNIQQKRMLHVAMPVPNNFTCSKKDDFNKKRE